MLVTVGVCVSLVMAVVGWVGAGMEVMDGMHAGQSQGGFRCSLRVRGEDNDNTRSHRHLGAQLWVGSCQNRSVSLEDPNTGCHEKYPARCPFSRLATLHAALRTIMY